MSTQNLAFGLTLPQRGALFDVIDGKGLIELGRQADQNPLFDSVWVGDSLFAKPRPDSIALLGALAGVTSRVKLAVGCMASFPVRDPIIFAYQWATLDLLSEGRMLLAVCSGVTEGASESEGAHWGVSDKERSSRMSENIDICRTLWTGETVSFEGRWRSFRNITMAPAPVQNPCPIWIAANPRTQTMPGALRRVAEKADGWMTVEMYPGMLGAIWKPLMEALRTAGRDPASFPNVAYHNVNINEDKAAALEESKRFLDLYYGPIFNEDVVSAWTAAGSPEECVEHIRRLRDSGAKAITFRITSWDQWGQYRRLTEEVLPRV